MEKCLACGGSRLVEGDCRVRDQVGPSAKVFRPHPCVRSFMLCSPDVPLERKGDFSACLDCGLVWSKLDEEALTTVLKKYAKKEELEQLDLAD